ncbi:MAG: M48 family metalloprotease [Desulfobulbaceae bacterium]|nr:M48 family metalloprotease [Desulfobulbaceae bacterium]
MQFLKALILMIVIPIFGFGVSKWVLYDLNAEIAKQNADFTISKICTPEVLSQLPSLQSVCDEVSPILWMQKGSILSGIIALLLLLSFVFFALVAGKSRTRIAVIFPPLIFCSLLVLSALVLIQGIILTYGAYLAESTAIQRVHFFLIGGIGLGALVGAFSLIQSSFKLGTKQPHSVVGTTLSQSENKATYDFVKEIANKLNATSPDNIVVGLEPNFYVTSADVKVIGDDKMLSGETLYISLPLARILSMEEIKAVIGHELGHFRGKDTIYSRKFSPVYSGLIHAVSAMEVEESNDNSSGIAKIPAFVLLSYMIDVFHRNVSAISREREFEADKASSEVAAPEALATSLLKISLYAHFWNNLQKSVIARLEQRKMTRNISKLFSSSVKYDVNQEALPEVLKSITQETISHPTDSHPPTGTRIQQLGVQMESIDNSLLTMPQKAAIDIIQDYPALEEKLSTLQQQYYVALGVQVPDESEINYGAMILAALGAHMVLADGKVEQEEIDQAEAIGATLSDKFDRIDFREYCHYPESIPPIEDLVEALAEMPVEAKKAIYDYLKEIAGSNQEISQEEEKLLGQLKDNLLN